jgi:hypothetical protein
MAKNWSSRFLMKLTGRFVSDHDWEGEPIDQPTSNQSEPSGATSMEEDVRRMFDWDVVF